MKSTCIFTLPRSGSSVLLSVLSAGSGSQSAAEFLNLPPGHLTRAIRLNLSGDFHADVKVVPMLTPSLKAQLRDFAITEYSRRVQIIEEHPTPLIFKAPLTSTFFTFKKELLQDALSRFKPIVLIREDGFKGLLSWLICENLQTWHSTSGAKLAPSEKLLVSRDEFIALIGSYNELVNLYNQTQPNQRITFEQFEDDPIAALKERFDLKLPIPPLTLRPFIEDHEGCFEDVDELRRLFAEKALRIAR